jgi:hypothetical protein
MNKEHKKMNCGARKRFFYKFQEKELKPRKLDLISKQTEIDQRERRS